MIVTPENMTFEGKRFCAILYGSPGVGKTTLAMSAPDPFLIDTDKGADRLSLPHVFGKPVSVCKTYEEILKDMESPEFKAAQTLIIDTGGSFITYLQDWAMRINPALNKQRNGGISQKGYGAVKNEAISFTNKVKTVLNKNLIFVFHSTEQADKDGNPTQRLMCEGAFKNFIWTIADFGGFVHMIGDERKIGFSPTQEYYAKNTHGISGVLSIPEIGANGKNDFMSRLFDQARANIAAEVAGFAPVKAQFDLVMETVHQILDTVKDAETANRALQDIPNLAHVLTSKKESSAMLNERAKSLGLVYSKSAGGFVPREEKEA